MEGDKTALRQERAPLEFSLFPRSCDTRRTPALYSFITYSVPIARLEIMRYIRTTAEDTWRGRGKGVGDINSGLDVSLIARMVNDSVISAITDNGGALDEN